MLDLDALEALLRDIPEDERWGRYWTVDKARRQIADAAPALIAELRELRAYRDEVEANKPTVQALLDSGDLARSYAATLTSRVLDVQAANLWRPIAEAPKDRSGIEAIDSRTGFVRVVDYYTNPPCWVLQGASNEAYPLDYFTHWRPMPDPPEGA
jgi:hypothetical protein